MTHSTLVLRAASMILLAINVVMFASVSQAAGRIDDSALHATPMHDRFIVKYRDGSVEQRDPSRLQGTLNGAARRAKALLSPLPANSASTTAPLALRHLHRLAVGADAVQASRKLTQRDTLALMREIAADPDVEYVEIDARKKATAAPNDPSYNAQWHYYEATGGINLPAAWNLSRGAGAVVAVIDTGSSTHSDLSANLLPGYDFISDSITARDGGGRDSSPRDEGDWTLAGECDDPNSVAEDSSWHGTHVAGTIAAVTNNGKGVAGVAYQAKVVPVRVLGKCGGYTSDIADAIVWASGGSVAGVPKNANPAEVINLSLGGRGGCSATEQAAINGAVSRGTVVVVSAGNDNDNTAYYSPANCNNVIAVGAAGRTGGRSSYSNSGTRVDIAAPGGDGSDSVLSTLNIGKTTPSTEGYAGYQGTSMAAPHVAAVAALVQSIAATPKTPAQMERLLKNTAKPMPVSCLEGCGAGLLNAYEAVRQANSGQSAEYSVYAIGKQYVSGKTSVYVLNGHDGFKTFVAGMYTGLGNTGTNNAWEFRVGDYNRDGTPDLYAIYKTAATQKTEVHILNGATNYSTFLLHKALPLGRTGSDSSWQFLLGDYNRDGIIDLYAISKTASTARTEVHILNGANNFSSFLLHKATALGGTGRTDAWTFSLGDYNRDGRVDLYAIRKVSSSGRTEVHVLNGANNFSSFLLETATALGVTGGDNTWNFQVADFNGDGYPDLYAFNRNASGATEVHVLNGGNRFAGYLTHLRMNLSALGSDHSWELGLGVY